MKEKLIRPENISIFFNVIFKKIAVSKRISRYVVDGLIETSLRGVDSHGIRLMPHYVRAFQVGRINKNPKFSFKKTGYSTMLMDADHTFGITAGNIAMRKAINLAKKSGAGAIAVKNSSHFGAAAIYSLLAARKDMIGLSFTHVESLVLPYGGKKPFLGTNPICFAAPCQDEEPFCLDMATTQMSWNKLLMYRSQNKKLARGWAADRKGKECTDPEKATYLLPIGTYKGYGLALMIDILCSLLTGMPFGLHIKPMYPLDKEKRFLGHFFMAIDIARFEEIDRFKQRLQDLINELRSIPSVAGFDKVRVAGDPEKESFKARSKKGIPVSEKELKSFIDLAKELQVERKYLKALLN